MVSPDLEYYKVFADADFGDERLNRRAAMISYVMEDSIEKGVNAVMPDYANYIGTLRFMNNPSITPEVILEPFFDASISNIPASHILFIQDTTVKYQVAGLIKNNQLVRIEILENDV